MKALTFLAVLVAGLVFADRSAMAQEDPMAYVQRLAEETRQRAQESAFNAVMAYRHQTGDWNTPDQQVFDYLVQQSRQANPGFYADLEQRERAFYEQQRNYAANRNAIMDGMHQSYMDRSNADYQAHRRYVQQVIREHSNFTDGSTVYDLPYYQPGNFHQGHDGSMMYQDYSGQYHHYNGGGWYSEMNEID